MNIQTTQAEELLFKYYGIEGEAVRLAGEVDFNFKISIEGSPRYLLKISDSSTDLEQLQFQNALLGYLARSKAKAYTPRVIPNLEGNFYSIFNLKENQKYYIRLLSWTEGRIYAQIKPHSDKLRKELGEVCGIISNSLINFEEAFMSRKEPWDLAQSLWIKDHLALFDEKISIQISFFIDRFKQSLNAYESLRKSVIHNDANDNNIVVSAALVDPHIVGLIDFGDAIYTQSINDLAIACAYAMMHHEDPVAAAIPIIQGYHSNFSISEKELEFLYTLVGMRLAVSITASEINKNQFPDNKYLLISQAPALKLLEKWHKLDPDFALYNFRFACGYDVHPSRKRFDSWIKKRQFSLYQLFPSIQRNQVHLLDLSVSSKWIGPKEDFNDLDLFQFKIEQLQKKVPDKIMAGGYLEPRPLYTSGAYDKIGNQGPESRTVHLGIDFWLPAGTPVQTLFKGEIVIAVNDAGEKEYGGLIVLKHQIEDLVFYTLYGHLSPSEVLKKQLGEVLEAGECIGHLGNYPENGNWAPHLHFQVMLSLLDYKTDFPGVCYFNQKEVWKGICPDPNSFFKIEALKTPVPPSNEELTKFRSSHIGKSMSLQYQEPLQIVRGDGAYLIDQNGRKYLDTVNNVAHVGHENIAVVRASQAQTALLNTNSRYLHPNIVDFSKALLKTLPAELCVLHFVNSGSEANELAIRMAKAATNEKNIIASEVGYHGNTNMCVDISSYKFDGKGGKGAPEHTHIFPLPDTFRGKYRGAYAAEAYAKEVEKLIHQIQASDQGLAALIVEPIISCGGQIELPEGFLKTAYQQVRKAGGVCISDEVQVGCGRMGKTFWGFQLHDVIPDIITIGKPIGNGHPLAVVACTAAVAEKFANGMEYFNTFGGNPVSCAIGAEVLNQIEINRLQAHALEVGNFLKAELKKLSLLFPIIGDVRGQGLFLGIELTDSALKPLTAHAGYLINRMKAHGILMSSDGPDNNVIKIKPPMVFSQKNAEEVIYYLEKILKEDFMQQY